MARRQPDRALGPDCVYYAATRFDAAAAGFDDARLYDELGEPRERTLPLVHIADPDSNLPFEAWTRNPDRVPY